MKHLRFAAIFLLSSGLLARGNTLYVDLNSANPTPPFSDWSTAATNIQDAIDASSDGDQIWVTNGVYQTGGKVMVGNLTNRVAVDKAVTVQSVNGPFVTTIAGIGATNSTIAVRCVWLTNNAALIGFTLTRGATRTSANGDTTNLQSGGAIWCASSNAVVTGCVVASNTAFFRAGGVYQGTLNTCFISSNSIQFPSSTGGAVYAGTLNNCTVVSNNCEGFVNCQATNCICYYNQPGNYNGGTLAYSCTTPAATGSGNFTSAPQFFADRIHLIAGSAGIGAGTTPITGADIFGNAWGSPPSVGCAESSGQLVTAPRVQLTSAPVGFTMTNVFVSGTGTLTFYWLKDGTPLHDDGHFSFTQSTNLTATGVNFADAGNYQLVVSNASGMVTSAVAQVVIHCVDVAGINPASPYTSWETAATNIQDAIVAAAANEIVLVTNGVYATGGKSMDGVITNRVSLDKGILLTSVNGAARTTIQGALDPVNTNGPGAVRCVWMTNNAILNGFTITGGATGTSITFSSWIAGGGIFASSNSAVVWNCTISRNYAYSSGGGANKGSLNNCTLVGNHVLGSPNIGNSGGAGASQCNLQNCLVGNNVVEQTGSGGGGAGCRATNCAFLNNRAPDGGGFSGTCVNCTIVGNTSTGNDGQSAAVVSSTLINSIVLWNINHGIAPTNSVGCTFSYSDSDPLPSGTGNIDIDPQLSADNVHVASTSPCLGAGTATGLTGVDIDNQAWNNPPAMGCDEWQPTPAIGFLSPQVGGPSPRALSFPTLAAGQGPFAYYWFKDGALLQTDGHYDTTSNLIVNNFQPDDAGFYQLVLSNSFGSVTGQLQHVVIHAVDPAGTNPQAPYSSWPTAATNIQDSIDAANPGDIVLVTNGIYSSGGKVMSGDLTNRVVLNKAVTMISVNGYGSTVIEGQWDIPATNGPGAVRCAWIGDEAILNGFTLRNGATRGGNFLSDELQSGGGAWLSSNAVVSNCELTNNSARWHGGGVVFGTANNCFLTHNNAQNGGGAYGAKLNNCTVRENHSYYLIGGAAGVDSCISRNCIVFGNYQTSPGYADYSLANHPNAFPDIFTNCCTSPLPFRGTNNITSDPQFLDYNDGFALSPASPCHGAGNPLFATGTDLDGEPYRNPPSMGCDEFIATNLAGPLSFEFLYYGTNALAYHTIFFASQFAGRPSELDWNFGDGPTATNLGAYLTHVWTNAGTYTVTLTAYNADHPSGVSSSLVVTVDPFLSPSLQSAGIVSNAYQFSFLAQGYGLYTVQYATNLTPPVAWQNLQVFLFSTSNTVMTIQDPAITNSPRFYRVFGQ